MRSLLVGNNRHMGARAQRHHPVFSIVTPFMKDGSIDWDGLQGYISTLYAAGARSFYSMPYNSRHGLMRREELLAFNRFVIQAAREAGQDSLVIVGDPLQASTAEVAEFARDAHYAGADYFSCLFPERYYTTQQVLDHYKVIHQRSGLELIVHQMPLISGRDGSQIQWPSDLLTRVLELPGVYGMKEDSKNEEVGRIVYSQFADHKWIIQSGGGYEEFVRRTQWGAKSWLNGVGVFRPDVTIQFGRALDAESSEGVEWILRVFDRPFFSEFASRFGWHRAMRSAIEAAGLFDRWEILPMVALSHDDHEKVVQFVQSLPNVAETGRVMDGLVLKRGGETRASHDRR